MYTTQRKAAPKVKPGTVSQRAKYATDETNYIYRVFSSKAVSRERSFITSVTQFLCSCAFAVKMDGDRIQDSIFHISVL